MLQSGSKSNTRVLAVRRKAPLTGYVVIGFYDSDRAVLRAFRRKHLKEAILFDAAEHVDDLSLPNLFYELH